MVTSPQRGRRLVIFPAFRLLWSHRTQKNDSLPRGSTAEFQFFVITPFYAVITKCRFLAKTSQIYKNPIYLPDFVVSLRTQQ
jgi:hypothetical protein